MLQKRKLGTQGLEVGAIGLGWLSMSRPDAVASEEEAITMVHRALELGVNFFDTAEVYGPFINEELLGKALKGKRHKAIIATKFGYDIQNGRIEGVNSQPAHIRKVVDMSLKRLGIDYIDLLYQHRVDRKVPIEDVVGVMADLVHEGKVRFLGLSEAGVNTIRRAHKIHPISALQSEYSIWERNLEVDIIPLLRELGIGLVPFSPLGRGFLSGKAKRAEEYPTTHSLSKDNRFQGSHYDANLRFVELTRSVAAQVKYTPAQVALAWLLHKGEDIVPIPGTKHSVYLEENVRAAGLILSAQEMQQLDGFSGAATGVRCSEKFMAMIDR